MAKQTKVKRKQTGSKAETTKYQFGSAENGVSVVVSEAFTDYGLHVWPGGLLLAEYLWQNPHLVANEIVLELGAGVALPGLLAARLDAKQVYLSDTAEDGGYILENIQSSIDTNELSNAQTLSLKWGRFTTETIKLRPTVIIGADLFYDERDFEDILANLQFYFDRRCDAFYTVVHNRGTCRALGALLLRWKMKVDEINTEPIIMNSDWLNLDESTNLLLVKITSVKQSNKSTHARNQSVLGLLNMTAIDEDGSMSSSPPHSSDSSRSNTRTPLSSHRGSLTSNSDYFSDLDTPTVETPIPQR